MLCALLSFLIAVQKANLRQNAPLYGAKSTEKNRRPAPISRTSRPALNSLDGEVESKINRSRDIKERLELFDEQPFIVTHIRPVELLKRIN
jgi:hypothetical protein